MVRLVLLAASLSLTPALVAQRYLVASAHATQPTSRLLIADAAAGSWAPLPGFPSDSFAPRAVAHDPLNGDAVLALDLGTQTRIVRVTTTAPVTEQILADLPGVVVDLTVMHTGDLYAVVDAPAAQAGLWRVPRRGGMPTLVEPLVEPAAITAFGPETTYCTLVESGAPAPASRDATLVYLDVATGSRSSASQPGQTRAVVAALDLPTAVPRTVFGHPDGSLTLIEFGQPPVPIQVQNFGPGNVRTLSWDFRGGILTLGGAVHPYLKSLPPIPPAGTPVPWTLLVGPLPGDPIDMDPLFDGVQAWRFGEACSTAASISSAGVAAGPQLGDASFAIALQGAAPSAPALLALGFREDFAASAGGAPLPAALPSGCALLVDPEALFFAATNPLGFTAQPLPVPNLPALLGLRAYVQWLLWQGAPFETTQALSLQIGS